MLEGQSLTLGRIRITYTAGISPLGSGRGSDRADPRRGRRRGEAASPPPPRPSSCRGRATSAARSPASRRRRTPRTSSRSPTPPSATRPRRSSPTPPATSARAPAPTCSASSATTVVTPPLSAGCLAGVTRDLVVEWCDVDERDISMEEFAQADEVFLTSTTRDVQGVHTVDDRVLPPATPVTDRVAAVWREREPHDVDP